MRRVVAVLGTAALLAASGVAIVTAPDDDEEFAAIEVRGPAGTIVESRVLDAELVAVRAGETLEVRGPVAETSADLESETPGVWVVADVVLTAKADGAGVAGAELHIDAYRFASTEILPFPSLKTASLNPGVPLTGSLAFEVPRFALELPGAGAATISPLGSPEVGPDSVPMLVADLTRLDIEPRATVASAQEVGLR